MPYLPHSDQPCKDCTSFDSRDELAKQGMIVAIDMGHCDFDPSWRFKSPYTTCKRFCRRK